jgi:hypothetical protein
LYFLNGSKILKSTKDKIGICNWSASSIAMEFLFAFIITNNLEYRVSRFLQNIFASF